MTREQTQSFVGKLVNGLLVIGAVVGSAFWLDDRVEAKISTRLCPIETEVRSVREMDKTLIKIETRLAAIEDLIDYQISRERKNVDRKGDEEQ